MRQTKQIKNMTLAPREQSQPYNALKKTSGQGL